MTARICVVSPTGNVSGAEVVLLNLVTEALRRGVEVRCLCPDGELVSRLPAAAQRVCIPEQALGRGPKAVAAAELGLSARAAADVIRVWSADCSAVVVNGFLALPAIRFANQQAPVSWIVHDVLRRRDWFAVLRLVRQSITVAIAVSHAAGAPLRARGLPVRVVPNGVTWPVAARPGDPDTPVVGCVAALTPWKGHRDLLDAFAQLEHRNAQLQLAGGPFPKDQAYALELRARANEPDLVDRVDFLGRVDARAAMRGWSVGVSPSIEPEAMPLVVLEAMSVGLPMVATALGGSLELLGHGGGFLVPPGSPGRLARAIDDLLDNHTERQRLAAWGREQVAERYRLKCQIERLLDAVAGGPW